MDEIAETILGYDVTSDSNIKTMFGLCDKEVLSDERVIIPDTGGKIIYRVTINFDSGVDHLIEGPWMRKRI
jgi:hypothetical protein